MENPNIINKIIKDNYKIKERNHDENEDKNIVNSQIPENSFDQLLSLQLLIQKYSGLKELCQYL